mmetsp:Transcript_37414/g.101331  ORF Transcript_37414/g.101331 Transcript_37414/m.101331 type:complete len:167 (-) Transcript_37414:71-571(-)
MKRREWLEGTRVRVTHSTLTLMSYPRPPPFAQVDHPSGFRLLFALPPDAATGTKVMLSVPACSGEIPALTAVKAEDVKHGMVGGIPTTSSTALKMVEWKENAEQPNCKVCNTEFGFTRWHHHCRRCGMNVCNACSSTRKCIPGYAKDQRVCDTCVQYEMSTLIGTN